MIIKGNILDTDAKYILHQCNCVSAKSSGLAYQIFDKFPYANCYQIRTSPDKPGTIKIFGNGKDKRFIINAFAQVYPGGPSKNDDETLREQWFQDCLNCVMNIKDLESIALPFNIGCGLAKGNWNHYYKIIERFAEEVNALQKVDVKIYQL